MWDDTTHLGCDFAECYNSLVIVCIYGKAGNWGGQAPFSIAQRDKLNQSPEAGDFGGLPTCTDGGPMNNDGVTTDAVTTIPTTTTSTTTTTTTTTSTTSVPTDFVIPLGGDGVCQGQWGSQCIFPIDTPWGRATNCNFFVNLGFDSEYFFLYSEGDSHYVDICDPSDADCP